MILKSSDFEIHDFGKLLASILVPVLKPKASANGNAKSDGTGSSRKICSKRFGARKGGLDPPWVQGAAAVAGSG